MAANKKRTAPRLKKDEERASQHVSLLLTPKVWKKLKARADANGRPLSGEARFIITNALKEA